MTQQPPISRLRPVIRVFVSSTFSDLKHERDALQREVFPRLEQLCASRQFQFQAIDLRWGISSEAGDDHRTMRICFDELRRSQEVSPEPNFLILLGNRYGMRPLPEEISQAEYEQLAAAAQFGGEHRAPLPGTHGKTALQVLRDWYRCDENVLLPVTPTTAPDRAPLNYILQPRTQDLHDGRDYTRTNQKQRTYSQDWRDVQQVLRRIIDVAFLVESLDHRFEHIDWPQHVASVNNTRNPSRVIPQIVRFQGSATEQEIWHGALSAPNAERHVLAFFRDITNRDGFAPEEARDFYDLTETRGFDEAAAKRQNALRKVIAERLGKDATARVPYSRLKRENGKVVVDASETETKAFCDAVFERFRPIIERQIEAYWRNSAQGSMDRAARDLEIEQREYERFAEERGGEELFVGRQGELQAILDYVGSDSPWPLVIHGASGCGKTALLARASQEVAKTGKRNERFIGVAPRSSDLRSLLSSLCQELRQRNPRADALPNEIRQLRDEFSQHLQAATPERPLILFLDALDQLPDADSGRLLHWLPLDSLPAHVKLVVSCLSDRAAGDPAGQPYAELKRRPIPAENFINLDVLPEAEARLLLLDRWLQKAGRKLSDDQMARIEQHLASPACRQPIYLKLFFDEVQLWHSYDPAPMPGESVPALLEQLFDRLSLPTNHGPLLVNRVLGYLSASRHGLAENEILEVLFADLEYRGKLNESSEQTRHALPPNAKRIPIALWSRLRFDLAPYLTERAAPGANVLAFYHRQVGEWVRDHFAKSPGQGWHPHQRLADYFGAHEYFLESLEKQCARVKLLPPTPRPANVRTVDELPYQRLKVATLSEQWDDVEKLFTDLSFLEAKAEAGMVFDLATDFALALGAMPPQRPHYRTLRLLEEALRRDIHFIAEHPTTLFQCLWNICWWHDCPNAETHYHDTRPPTGTVTIIAGEMHFKWDKEQAETHGVPPPWRAAGPKLSHLLELWHERRFTAIPGMIWLRSLRPPPIRLGVGLIGALSGHKDIVTSVACSANDRFVASASWDNTVRLWDQESGRELLCLAHPNRVFSVSLSPSGDRLASVSRDGFLRIWDSHSGFEHLQIDVRQSDLTCICFSPDGRNIAGGGGRDQAVRIWECKTGAETRVLQQHRDAITCIAFAPNGCHLVSGSLDKTLTLWDIKSGRQTAVLKGHTRCVIGLAYTCDGSSIVSASEDKTVRVWDANSGAEVDILCPDVHELKGDDLPTRMAVSPDGQLIAVGSSNGTLRIQHLDSGAIIGSPHSHPSAVSSVAFTADGLAIVSASASCIWFWRTPPLLQSKELTERAAIRKQSHSPNHSRPIEECHLHIEYILDYMELSQHRDKIESIAFSPDGSRIVTGSSDHTVRVWDSALGLMLLVLRGHKGPVSSVSYSLDGRRIVSSSCGAFTIDETRRAWDASSGKCLETIPCCPDTSPIGVHSETSSLRALCSGQQTAIVLATSSQPVGWFPGPLDLCTAHPTSPLWAGTQSNHLYLISLETMGSIAGILTEIIVHELRKSADQSFQEGLWGLAASDFTKLLDAGEPLAEYAPNLITCLLNVHDQLLPGDATRIEALLSQLESAGQATLAIPLRQQFEAKRSGRKRPWWKVW